MTQTTAHFVFTLSGGGLLLQALRMAGRDDPVVCTVDDLSLGPIDPPDASLRAKWAEKELGRTAADDLPHSPQRERNEAKRVWNEALFAGHRKIAWLTRRSAKEYAGFLDWLWRLGDTPCDMVDLTDVKISHHPKHGPPQPPTLAMPVNLHPDAIRDNNLWDLAKPLEIAERRRYLEFWRQLLSENAALRVTDGEKLSSAPISFFDDLLTSYVTDKWQKVARVVGHASAFGFGDRIVSPGDALLLGRLNALIKDNRLELRGESIHQMKMHLSEVRLPRERGYV
jgi:hypothetical protein